MKSNGGIRRKSNNARVAIPPIENFSIKGKKAFPIYLDEEDSKKTFIFARGHRIMKAKHPMLSQLIKQLNQGDVITMASIRDQMEPLWDLIEVLGFVQELLNTEAVTVENI